MTVHEFVTSVYANLGPVSETEIGLNSILRWTRDEEAALIVDMEMAGDPGEILETVVTVDQGTDTYVVAVAPQAFGRSVIAEAAIMEGGYEAGRRRVDVVDLED